MKEALQSLRAGNILWEEIGVMGEIMGRPLWLHLRINT